MMYFPWISILIAFIRPPLLFLAIFVQFKQQFCDFALDLRPVGLFGARLVVVNVVQNHEQGAQDERIYPALERGHGMMSAPNRQPMEIASVTPISTTNSKAVARTSLVASRRMLTSFSMIPPFDFFEAPLDAALAAWV